MGNPCRRYIQPRAIKESEEVAHGEHPDGAVLRDRSNMTSALDGEELLRKQKRNRHHLVRGHPESTFTLGGRGYIRSSAGGGGKNEKPKKT